LFKDSTKYADEVEDDPLEPRRGRWLESSPRIGLMTMAEFGASLQICVVGLAIYGNRAVNIPNTVELTVRTVEIDLQ
jgi:hypothetical protein